MARRTPWSPHPSSRLRRRCVMTSSTCSAEQKPSWPHRRPSLRRGSDNFLYGFKTACGRSPWVTVSALMIAPGIGSTHGGAHSRDPGRGHRVGVGWGYLSVLLRAAVTAAATTTATVLRLGRRRQGRRDVRGVGGGIDQICLAGAAPGVGSSRELVEGCEQLCVAALAVAAHAGCRGLGGMGLRGHGAVGDVHLGLCGLPEPENLRGQRRELASPAGGVLGLAGLALRDL